jgi:hypothetical protein
MYVFDGVNKDKILGDIVFTVVGLLYRADLHNTKL